MVDFTRTECCGLELENFKEMRLGERLDYFAKFIMLNGLQRPWFLYAWHAAILLTNYLGFLLLVWLVPAPVDMSEGDYYMLIFVKLVVWQHLAEAIGCRQGPLMGHFGLPNNYKFRLSRGTFRYAVLPGFGDKRTFLDQCIHTLFFVACLAFLLSPHYEVHYIRLVIACDVYIFFFDLTQFFASTGHAYGTMLLAACFPVEDGRMAGMQLGLIMQWFFSGIGKVGPWFTYVNGPFMMQSKLLAGRRWLFNLLFRSPEDLSPTAFGAFLGHVAAAVEWVAPLALMVPLNASIWTGLIAITAMHVYILTMPAPFDVYSWNLCFGLSGIYLFYVGSFGLDIQSAFAMSPWLAAFIFSEFCLCWYGQFFPDQVGYYLSHRYWAGNWVQCCFLIKKSSAVREKLNRVHTFNSNPVPLPGSNAPYIIQCAMYMSYAYLWLGNLNMKCIVRVIEDLMESVDGCNANIDDWVLSLGGLNNYCCGEFRDQLYAAPILPAMQEKIGFDSGECFMVQLGAFANCRTASTWTVHDLKKGIIAEGKFTRDKLYEIDSLPSKSMDVSSGFDLSKAVADSDPTKSALDQPLLAA